MRIAEESAVQKGLPAHRETEQLYAWRMRRKAPRALRCFTVIKTNVRGALQSAQCALCIVSCRSFLIPVTSAEPV